MKNIIILLFLILFNAAPHYSCGKHNCSDHIELNNGVIAVKLIGDNSSPWEKHLPWIVAVFLGVLTVIVNIRISSKAQKIATRSSELDFNKTVLSENRQTWINELRDVISKILSKSLVYAEKKNIDRNEMEQISYLITKAKLMLNPKNDKEFIKSLDELNTTFIKILAEKKEFLDLKPHRAAVYANTQKTLKTEWERVKRGE